MGSMIAGSGSPHMCPIDTRSSRMVNPNSGHSRAFRVASCPTVSFCCASHVSTISASGATGVAVKPISTARSSI